MTLEVLTISAKLLQRLFNYNTIVITSFIADLIHRWSFTSLVLLAFYEEPSGFTIRTMVETVQGRDCYSLKAVPQAD